MLCLSRVTMKTSSLIFMVVGLFMAANTSEAEDQNDLQKLQGTWKLVSAAQDAKPLPNDKIRQTGIDTRHKHESQIQSYT
jgi:hypothetical protein